MAGRVRKMFPGGNTSQGFYSYYNYIISEDANRVFVIKGGPGVGKSSFMKKMAKEMTELGFDIEMHYCSSDNNSLDAVVIEDLKIALLDGTAPHVVDPKYPGAVDEIINFGEFWDVGALEKCRGDIVKYTREISRHFARAYKLLAAAKLVMDDIEEKYSSSMDYGRANLAAEEWAGEIFAGWPVSAIPGKDRHLFGSAYTPGGFVDYSETILENVQRTYYVNGHPGTGKTFILNRLAGYASDRGVEVEYFHRPLKPHKLDTIVLKELGVAVTCSTEGKKTADRAVDLNLMLDRDRLGGSMEDIEGDMHLYEQLQAEAIAAIYNAKKTHDRLEEHYINNMDFKAVDRLKDRILERILEYR